MLRKTIRKKSGQEGTVCRWDKGGVCKLAKYLGWDIRTPKGILPASLIGAEGLEQTPNALMDLNPRRTGKGLLIRNVLPYSATTITITTPAMGLKKKIEFQSYFPSRETIEITYYNEETNDYRTANFYIPEITWKRYGFLRGEPFYLPATVELIGYGEKRA